MQFDTDILPVFAQYCTVCAVVIVVRHFRLVLAN